MFLSSNGLKFRKKSKNKKPQPSSLFRNQRPICVWFLTINFSNVLQQNLSFITWKGREAIIHSVDGVKKFSCHSVWTEWAIPEEYDSKKIVVISLFILPEVWCINSLLGDNVVYVILLAMLFPQLLFTMWLSLMWVGNNVVGHLCLVHVYSVRVTASLIGRDSLHFCSRIFTYSFSVTTWSLFFPSCPCHQLFLWTGGKNN